MIVELYVCLKCETVELELNGPCDKCGDELECVDFAPVSGPTPRPADLAKRTVQKKLSQAVSIMREAGITLVPPNR